MHFFVHSQRYRRYLSLLPLYLAIGTISGPVSAQNNTPDVRMLRKSNDLDGPVKVISLQVHEGTNMAATPSPDGKFVVFSLQGSLWKIPMQGGKATKLTPWNVEATAPVWSRDGKRIAFQNYADGNYHIWSIAPDGSDLQEVTSGPYDDREPAWSPDGASLLFASDRSGDGQYKIWRYTFADKQYTAVTKGAGAESNPVISPDGSRIAYVNDKTIYTLLLNGGAAPEKVDMGIAPAWSADGKSLIYRTPEGLAVNGKILPTDEDIFPFPARLLPQGGFLYTADGRIKRRNAEGEAAGEIPFKAELTLRRPVFKHRKDHQLDNVAPQRVQGISAPALSPDGKSIAFVALNDVWTMETGKAPRRLTDDKDRDGNPQWTRDGKAIYFSSEKNNAGALAVDRIDLASGKRSRIAAIAGTSMVTPSLSPDGKKLAYTTGSGRLEVYDIAARSSRVVIDEAASQPSRPNWTADGSKIIIVDNERINNRFREGYNKLRVVDVATGKAAFHAIGPAPLQISDRDEGAATLSPDGRLVAFIADSVLQVMPLNTDGTPAGAAVALTTEAADLPSWAGDSTTILYLATGKLKTISKDGADQRDIPFDLTWKQAVPEETTLIHAGALWNGLGATLQHDVDITIKGNRISSIRPHHGNRDKHNPHVRFIDASTLTVMPGLWDSHVHPLTIYQGGQLGPIWAEMIAYGVTSTQSVAGPLYQSLEIKESLEAGNLVGPRMFIAPPLWEGNRLYYSFARSLRNERVADIEIAKAKALNVDFLKSYVRAPIPVMAKIAQAAHQMGIPSGSHYLSPGIQVGLSETTHLQATQRMGYGWAKSTGGISYQDVMALYTKGNFNLVETHLDWPVPASALYVGLNQGARFEALTPLPFAKWLRELQPQPPENIAAVKKSATAPGKIMQTGGLVALGTDTPLVPPGIALHSNLRALGLTTSNLQALQAVTINAARINFLEKDLGSVEPGKIADLIIVRGNPLENLENAANVEYVLKNGFAYTIPQILAPFQTKEELAARAAAELAFQRLCNADKDACHLTPHGHAD